MHVVRLGFSEPTGHRTGRGWARASEATVQESEHEGRAHGEGPSPHRPREKGSAMQMGALTLLSLMRALALRGPVPRSPH